MVAMIGLCSIMPTVEVMSNTISPERHTLIKSDGDLKVGDYMAWVNKFDGIQISVYSYANSCYNYYTIIKGEKYAVMKNSQYDPKSKSSLVEYRYTHYIQYLNRKYYFSIE